jgi:hypothetical protein
MFIVKATGYTEAGLNDNWEHNDAMIEYNKSLAKAGVLLTAEELQPSASGTRIFYPLHDREPELQAGPFSVDQKLIAGFTLIDVSSEDEAIDWARRMPVPRGFREFEIEMRKLKEKKDFIQDPRTLAMEADLEDQINMLKKI